MSESVRATAHGSDVLEGLIVDQYFGTEGLRCVTGSNRAFAVKESDSSSLWRAHRVTPPTRTHPLELLISSNADFVGWVGFSQSGEIRSLGCQPVARPILILFSPVLKRLLVFIVLKIHHFVNCEPRTPVQTSSSWRDH